MKGNGVFWTALTIALFFSKMIHAQWTEIHDLQGASVLGFAASDSGVWMAGSEGISYLGENFQSLETHNTGLSTTYISDIDIFGYYLAAGTQDGIFLSKDGGLSWENVSGEEFASLNIRSVASNDSMLLTGVNGGLYRSMNSGRSWEDFSEGLSAYATFVLKPYGQGFLAATDGGVYRHSLEAGTWELISEEIVRDILVSDGQLILGGDYGIYVSQDLGSSWNPDMMGMENALVSSLAKVGASYFAGTQTSGVYHSTDLLTWEAWNNGLEETGITSLVGVRDTFLLCGTTSGKLALLDIFSEGSSATAWHSTGMENFRVWPNPARGFVFVESGISGGELQLELFASTGSLIHRQTMAAELHLRIDLPQQKGIYFLRLKAADGRSAMRKIVSY